MLEWNDLTQISIFEWGMVKFKLINHLHWIDIKALYRWLDE